MTEMDQLKSGIIEAVEKVRTENPLAGSVTNGVTMDFVANAQLAVGGSAAMVYLPDEGECLVAAGGAVYLNMAHCFPSIGKRCPVRLQRLSKVANLGFWILLASALVSFVAICFKS